MKVGRNPWQISKEQGSRRAGKGVGVEAAVIEALKRKRKIIEKRPLMFEVVFYNKRTMGEKKKKKEKEKQTHRLNER